MLYAKWNRGDSDIKKRRRPRAPAVVLPQEIWLPLNWEHTAGEPHSFASVRLVRTLTVPGRSFFFGGLSERRNSNCLFRDLVLRGKGVRGIPPRESRKLAVYTVVQHLVSWGLVRLHQSFRVIHTSCTYTAFTRNGLVPCCPIMVLLASEREKGMVFSKVVCDALPWA